MSRLTRDGTAEPISLDQIIWRELGEGNIIFPCSADHEQDWQPYPVDLHSAIWYGHAYIHMRTSKHKKTNSNRVNDSTFFGPFLNNCCFVVVVAKLE